MIYLLLVSDMKGDGALVKLHHVSLLSHDAMGTIHFYRDILGLRLVKNTVNQENIHMRHLFFGDYLGTPGSVVTFFIVDRLGNRYTGPNQLGGIDLAVPTQSLDAWQARLHDADIAVSRVNGELAFVDNTATPIRLRAQSGQLPAAQVVKNDIPAAMQILGLANVDIFTADVAREQAFFTRLLQIEPDGMAFHLEKGQTITFRPGVSSGIKRFGRGSMDHFALSAPSDAALGDLATTAARAHDPIEEQADRGWFKSVYLRDPGDNRIELATTFPGFSLDEAIADMGRGLGLPPAFADQRHMILDYFKTKGVTFND